MYSIISRGISCGFRIVYITHFSFLSSSIALLIPLVSCVSLFPIDRDEPQMHVSDFACVCCTNLNGRHSCWCMVIEKIEIKTLHLE